MPTGMDLAGDLATPEGDINPNSLFQAGWAPANAPVIERHSPSFDPETGDGGLSLWIPLAD